MTAREQPAKVEHATSSGLQIIAVGGGGGDSIAKVLVDERTRHTFPMDEVQWRELEMYVVAHVALKNRDSK